MSINDKMEQLMLVLISVLLQNEDPEQLYFSVIMILFFITAFGQCFKD